MILYQQHSTMEKKGFDDCKALTGEAQSTLFTKILRETPELGVCVRVLHASEISRNIFRAGGPYNLNEMSHDAAIHRICSIRAAGVAIERVYVDTVGNEKAYQTKSEQVFQGSGIKFVVEKKAYSKYVSCSAASIVVTCHLSIGIAPCTTAQLSVGIFLRLGAPRLCLSDSSLSLLVARLFLVLASFF